MTSELPAAGPARNAHIAICRIGDISVIADTLADAVTQAFCRAMEATS